VQLAQTYTSPTGYASSILFRVAKDLHSANYHCTTLLGAGGYQLLLVDTPNVPAAELKAALGWRVKDMIDFPLEQATLDFALLPPQKNGSAHTAHAFAVVARNSVLQPHQQVFWENKVALDAIDIDEMAQRNISALLEPKAAALPCWFSMATVVCSRSAMAASCIWHAAWILPCISCWTPIASGARICMTASR
jgi:MSHA biogenesis protein MshI